MFYYYILLDLKDACSIWRPLCKLGRSIWVQFRSNMSIARLKMKENGLFLGLSESLNVSQEVVRAFKLVSEIYKEHHKNLTSFAKPVNPSSWDLHNYCEVIKKPMDLKTSMSDYCLHD